jgi:sec-independent protein translocase protein TatA
MGMPGGIEWIVILAVVVLLFGAKKIPAVAEGLGKGIKNFKKAMKSEEEIEDNSKTASKDEKIAEEKKV